MPAVHASAKSLVAHGPVEVEAIRAVSHVVALAFPGRLLTLSSRNNANSHPGVQKSARQNAADICGGCRGVRWILGRQRLWLRPLVALV